MAVPRCPQPPVFFDASGSRLNPGIRHRPHPPRDGVMGMFARPLHPQEGTVLELLVRRDIPGCWAGRCDSDGAPGTVSGYTGIHMVPGHPPEEGGCAHSLGILSLCLFVPFSVSSFPF